MFSKAYESFLVAWLKKQVIEFIDPRQVGNIPKTSTAHYLVSMLDTVFKYLDQPDRRINLMAIDLKPFTPFGIRA